MWDLCRTSLSQSFSFLVFVLTYNLLSSAHGCVTEKCWCLFVLWRALIDSLVNYILQRCSSHIHALHVFFDQCVRETNVVLKQYFSALTVIYLYESAVLYDFTVLKSVRIDTSLQNGFHCWPEGVTPINQKLLIGEDRHQPSTNSITALQFHL